MSNADWIRNRKICLDPLSLTAGGAAMVGLFLLASFQGTLTAERIYTLTAEQAEILSHQSIVYLDDGLGGTVKTLRISGINVPIVNGLGATNGFPPSPHTVDPGQTQVNGLGNLIVGYNELGIVVANERTGSHNIVVGHGNNYTSFGGRVAGYDNTLSGPYATVTGGRENAASGPWAWVGGGNDNLAIGDYSAVSGGRGGEAHGRSSSVSGGNANMAYGVYASISGGSNNTVNGNHGSVSGGRFNEASGDFASVSGGWANTASELASSVSGGRTNSASNTYSSVSGGRFNDASGYWSSVSGGLSRSATGDDDWVAGSLSEDY